MAENHHSRRKAAVLCIERCWCCHRDRYMFSIMKQAIRSAEHSLTSEILRKINPREAELLSDPVFKPKIRFRFSGEEFPPNIVFKIFIKTNGRGIKYFCGKKTLRASTEAARESCEMMGNRKYFDQMIADMWENEKYKINDEIDVSNIQDYMKYLSAVDERTPVTGGKGNPWRTLTLEDLPRHHLIYDVVDCLQSKMTSSLFLKYLRGNNGILFSQSKQLEYIENIKSISKKSSREDSRRRSKQAVDRAKKMQKLYKYGGDDEIENNDRMADGIVSRQIENDGRMTYGGGESSEISRKKIGDRLLPVDIIKGDVDVDDESWDEEGKYLFEWTRTLSLDKFS